jgi:hypothetical protein
MQITVYVVEAGSCDWQEITGVYCSLERAKASCPNADWEGDDTNGYSDAKQPQGYSLTIAPHLVR